MGAHRVALTVNGAAAEVVVEARELLADTLRDRFGYTGVHIACGHGSCGACAVLVDGAGVRSCLMFTVQAAGTTVTTVEGVADGDELHPVQVALSQRHGLQCGYCTPGVLISAVELLAERSGERPPSRGEIRRRLAGNLCRCTGYAGMVDAVEQVAREDGG
jgi:carbon-monoxide dehydrogenase small subunit